MDKEFLKGREYIQRNIVKVEENGEDFGALLKQMNSYKKVFNKLPKSTQNKLNQMELKEMVKETKKIIDEKERVLKWNREMDKKEKEEKEKEEKEKKEKEEKEKEEKEKEEKKRPRSPSESPPTQLPPTQLPLKKCKEGEEINPATGRCRKVCPVGTTRNEKGVCVKTAKKTTAKKCKDDEEINPATGRCRKRCPPDKIRNEKGVCVSKTKKNKN